VDLYFQYKINGNKEAKKRLILSFMPMALKICQKFYVSAEGLLTMSELFDECYIIIDEAIDKYKPFSKLTTFVYNMIKWRLSEMVANAFTIVKMKSEDRKELKEQGVSLNWISIEEFLKQEEADDDDLAD